MLQVLSHPVRLQILDELRNQSCCVCHLQVLTGRPQAYISQQLSVLRDAGYVIDERDGQNVYYRLCNETLNRLLGEILGSGESAEILNECTCPKCASQVI